MIEAGLRAALEAATGSAAPAECSPVAGGCINRCYAVRRAGERFFVKLNSPGFADAFAAEADGLAALAAAGMRVPAPLAHGAAGAAAYLVLEWLPLGAPGERGFSALGERLAAMHGEGRGVFGWHRDNWIGATPQRNPSTAAWADFWIGSRLGPQLDLAAARGHLLDAVRATDAARAVLDGHRPAPALVHGDLWRGNAGVLDDGTPVVFDPAVYAGDAETDLAMTELFGGFPRAFLDAYRAVRPVDAGYRVRRDLYNLYHVLNHLNLFGEGYLGQACDLIDRVAAETR